MSNSTSASTYCDKTIEWGLVLVASLHPLVFSTLNYSMYALPKLVFLYLVVIVMVVAWAVKIVESRQVVFAPTALNLPILFFFLSAAATTLFSSVHFRTSLYGQITRYEGLLTILLYSLIYFLTVNFVKEKYQVRRMLTGLLIAASIVAIYGILQHFGIDFLSPNPRAVQVGRSFSTLGNPNFLGGYLVLVIPVGIAFMLSVKRLAPKLLVGLATVLLFVCLLFTYSRSAWLGTATSLALILLFVLKQAKRKEKMILLGAVAAVVMIACLLLMQINTKTTPLPLRERVASTTRLEEGTVVSRLIMWETSLEIIKSRPGLGFGLDTFRLTFPRYRLVDWYQVSKQAGIPDKAHNDLLQTASSQGLIGLLGYLWIIIAALWQGARTVMRARNEQVQILAVGLIAAISGYLIHLQFQFSGVETAPFLWLIVGMLLCINHVGKQEKPSLAISLRKDYLPSVVKNPTAKLWGMFADTEQKPHTAPNSPSTRSTRSGHSDFASPKQSCGACRRSVKYGIYAIISVLVLLSILPVSRFALADIHFAKGLKALALELPYSDRAIYELKQAIDYDPNEAFYWLILGHAYLGKGKSIREDPFWIEEAISAYTKAKQLNPLEIDNYSYLASAYSYYAESYGREGMFERALATCKQALVLDPNSAELRLDLGNIYFSHGMFDGSITQYQKAVKLNPSFAKAYFNLGVAYQEKGLITQAKAAYQEALKINPDYKKAKRALKKLEKE